MDVVKISYSHEEKSLFGGQHARFVEALRAAGFWVVEQPAADARSADAAAPEIVAALGGGDRAKLVLAHELEERVEKIRGVVQATLAGSIQRGRETRLRRVQVIDPRGGLVSEVGVPAAEPAK